MQRAGRAETPKLGGFGDLYLFGLEGERDDILLALEGGGFEVDHRVDQHVLKLFEGARIDGFGLEGEGRQAFNVGHADVGEAGLIRRVDAGDLAANLDFHGDFPLAEQAMTRGYCRGWRGSITS